MLLNCNALTETRLKSTEDDFKKHIKMIGEMKRDLDYIFRKIRTIKSKLVIQYPNAFHVQEDDDEEDTSGQRKDDPQVEYEQILQSPHNPSIQG